MKYSYTYFFTSFLGMLKVMLLWVTCVGAYAQCPTLFVPVDTTIACSATRTLYTPATVPVFNVSTTSCSPVTLTSPVTAFTTACDDCVTGQIPIGFSFNFFGTPYTTAVIQSNGLVGFGAFTFTGYSSFAIPAGGNPNNYIAGLFADIDIRFGGTITYQTVGTAPNRRFVVSYNNVVPYNSGSAPPASAGTASFQIILNENGTFHVAISQLSNNWNAATSGGFITSGAENADGSIAIAVPGRNAADIGGIVPGDQDCRIFQPVNCLFQNWSIGATVISTNNIFNVSPTANTTYTANWSCSGSPCSRSTVVTVSASAALSATASVTPNPVCIGSSATFTAVPVNGSASPTYQWTRNGTNITGATAITYTGVMGTDFVGGDLIRCVVTRPASACGVVSSAITSPITINSALPPTVTGATICQNGVSVAMTSASCGTGSASVAQGAVFNSGDLSSTDARWDRNIGGTTCGATATPNEYYDIFAFTVSTAGSYTFDMCHVGTTWDSHASLYQNAFNPASPCDIPSNFIVANDDGNSSCSAQSKLTATLATGITYYLISTSFSSGVTGVNYQWTFTGPAGATLIIPATSVVQWYTAPTGGTAIGTGTSFNPVGIAGSGLANTATIGTTTYYVACSTTPTCRIAVNYVINPSITPSVSITPISTSSASTTFTATASNVGGGTVTYTFRKNGTSQQSGASNTWNATGLVNGDNITCDISITGGTCLSATTATSNTAPVTLWVGTPDIYRGNMVSFPGVNGQINMTNAANIASRNFSIEFWFRLADVPTVPVRTMFSMGSNNANNEKLTIDVGNSNQIRVNFGNTNNTYTWTHTAGFHHLVVTYNQTTKLEELYVDGNFIGSNVRTTDYIGNRDMRLGNRQNGANQYFAGNMEEIRIWNEARTRNQIRENMHLTQPNQGTLIGYYQSNETTGALLDRVSASNGTFAGDVVRVASSVSVGGGTSKRTNILSAAGGAEFTLATTNMEIDFNTVVPNGELVVTQITAEAPYSPIPYSILSSSYWVVRNFGTNLTGLNFNNMRFQIPAGDNIPAADIITPANLKLFKRQHNAESTWFGASAAASANNVTKLIRFNTFVTASFSEFVIGSISTTLPPSLLDFSANRQNEEMVNLRWKTSTETNNKGFEVEVSQDGKAFEKIAFVEGVGSSTTQKNYTIDHKNDKDAYYRLKQIDQNNDFAYSNVLFIKGVEQSVKLYPNPTHDKLYVELGKWDTNQQANIEIINQEGKGILQTITKEKKTILDVHSLPKGVYFLKINHNQKMVTEKFVIE